jgi:hypothetical protein
LIIIVAGYTFSIEPGDYRLEIFEFALVLPKALLVTAPLLLLFIGTLLHMFFYGFKGYMSKRALAKDEENLSELLKDVLLNKESSRLFKSKEIKDIASVISQLNIVPKSVDFNSAKADINDIAHKIMKINAGEYIPAKELKLDDNNPLMQKNLSNKIKIDDDFAADVLKKSDKYSKELIKEAFNKVLESKSLTTVKKLLGSIVLDEEMTKNLLLKDAQQQESFSFGSDEILELVKKVELSQKDLMEIAKAYKTTMQPDQLIKLFEDISGANDLAVESHIYLLFEFEMIDAAREILAGSAKEEYVPYKALLDLKDAGKHYTLDSICY